MGRRSDHTRDQLRDLIVREGHAHLREVGFAAFSAREVAKRAGYSIGTIYNVFGSYDGLLLALNGHTLDEWQTALEDALAGLGSEAPAAHRLDVAIGAYFSFAFDNRQVWTALFDFRLPDGVPPPPDYTGKVRAIITVVEREVAHALPRLDADATAALARSLLAIVHGHCFFALNGTLAILGESDPLGAARARVREAIAAAAV